ncbi:hypothetical protein HPB50_012247 [Hyalomma asiaticum]|uniref:Uncharacterized protein n=1 Tax=Hyalomma asiaticum TaxID=266040 RepID=A0ACB7T7N4_HYAAI|nr:hypothetical protein HPB50_012247 [Hyalomma asiaticum]
MWVPESAILKREEELSSRFARAVRIYGTRSLHYFEPVSLSVLKVGFTSSSSTVNVSAVKESTPALL